MKKNILLSALFLSIALYCFAEPYVSVESLQDWNELLAPVGSMMNMARPMTPPEWQDYMDQSQQYTLEGDPYPSTQFYEALLYAAECNSGGGGGAGGCITDEATAGLVMTWGTPTGINADYASAWVLEYGEDPDLSNCILTIDVEAPCGMRQISLGLRDANGRMRAWYWNVAPFGAPGGPGLLSCSPSPAGIPVRNTINIDLTQQGIAAATPVAAAYMNHPQFDITQVVRIMFDENMKWVAGTVPPPPGGQIPKPWNYWFNLRIYPKNPYKTSWIKYAQLPYYQDAARRIYGWDQKSFYSTMAGTFPQMSMVTDDWVCKDNRPVTDIHWWGSFIGWRKTTLPPQVPDYFLICIWDNVPAGADTAWSHPGKLLWTHKCYKWVWNFAGYDTDPRWKYPTYNKNLFGPAQRNEACFQFNQLLSQNEYFKQKGPYNIYWISIAAVYENLPPSAIQYPWGWKTKPHQMLDVGGVITGVTGLWPPLTPGVNSVSGFYPLVLPDVPQYPSPTAEKFDLAFELTTNQKPRCYSLAGDLNHDCIVDINDFRDFAKDWLKVEP